ncbi:MAG: glycosyltransferase [Pseudomonadota bacterium]
MTRLLRAGSEENVLLTCKGQIEAGHRVTLVHGTPSTDALVKKYVPELPLVAVPDLVRPIKPREDLRAYRHMRRVFKDLKPDVVHTHQSKAGIIGRFAARAEGVPTIVHGVHILPFLGTGKLKRQAYLMAERLAARHTDGFVHVSSGMQSGCLENGIGMHAPHEVIASGFDIDRFKNAEAPDDWRSLLGIDPGADKPFTVLMIAALEPRKRHLELLDSLPDFFRSRPEARLTLAGEGALKDEISAKAETLGISHQVRMVGYREDPERLIALADLCILSSAQEGLPRAILQSLVGGTPVVTFDLPGIERITRHGENGYIIPMDNWSAFADAIARVADQETLKQGLSTAARRTDLTAWDWRSMGQRTNAFYERLRQQGA